MAKKKKQTIGYKYFASAHFVLCHGPIDAITKISFQDKDTYLNEENANKTIYINKPSLFGGDEQSGGVQGNIELLFGHADQQKSSVLQRICAKISNAFGGLISAYRGVCSVVFNDVYIGTAPNMPDSKWRVKRIHTRHDGELQWYDEKAEIPTYKADEIIGFSTGKVEASATTYMFPSVDNTSTAILAPNFPFFGGMSWGGAGVAPGQYKAKVALSGMVRYLIRISADNECYFSFEVGNIIIHSINKYGVGSQGYIELDVSVFWGGDILTIIAENTYWNANPGGYSPCSISFQADVIATYSAINATVGDINPAHVIRECLTNTIWGIGVSESNIDDESFRNAADTLYDENMGMSIKWTDSTSIQEFVDNIKEHINAQLYLDRVTNK